MRRLFDGYRRGMLAMVPAVVIACLPSLFFNRPWPLEPITEQVMHATPVDLAQQLILHLGAGARLLALLGGFAVLLLLGGVLGMIAVAPAGRLPRAMPPLAAFALVLLVLFVISPPARLDSHDHPGDGIHGMPLVEAMDPAGPPLTSRNGNGW